MSCIVDENGVVFSNPDFCYKVLDTTEDIFSSCVSVSKACNLVSRHAHFGPEVGFNGIRVRYTPPQICVAGISVCVDANNERMKARSCLVPKFLVAQTILQSSEVQFLNGMYKHLLRRGGHLSVMVIKFEKQVG